MANATSTTTAVPTSFVFQPSVIHLNDYSQYYVQNADILIAPWVTGAFADLFLQGILAAQTANYFNFRDADHSQRRFTWLVVFLTVLCLLKTSQNIVIVWDTVIATFANPDLSSMMVATLWSHYTTSLSTAIIATFCQGFFAYRYWLLTRQWYIGAIMVAGMVVSLIGATLVIVYIPLLEHATVKMWSLVHFVAAIIVDVLITVGTAWHLQIRKSNIQSTAEMIDRLVRMTWQSALPPTICVIVNAAVIESRTLDLIHIAFNTVLPKLYAISLMYTLNIRNEMRNERMTSHERSIGSRTHPVSAVGGNKQSFMPGASTYRHGTGGPSLGGMEAGIGSPAEKRGVSFIGGKGRGLSLSGRHDAQGRRIDGVHVETHVSRDGGASSGNTMELRSFHGDDIKVQPNELDQEVWDQQDRKYNAQ